MQRLVASHYAKALSAGVLRFVVSTGVSLAVSFAILSSQLGGVEATMAQLEGWVASLHAHVVARGIRLDIWLAVSASVIAGVCVFGPVLGFQIMRWRLPALKADAILPDQRRALLLHLDADKVFTLLKDILESDPALYDVHAQQTAGLLSARSIPFARFSPAATASPAPSGVEAVGFRPTARRILRYIDVPFVGAPRRAISIAVIPRAAGQCEVTVRSQFRTLLPVLDARAQNRRTVEAIAEALKARTPRLIAEQRAEVERAQLDRRLLDARLQVLRAQIEPHFLYNTLANVQYLIRNDPPAADAMIGELITYLRQSLPKMRDGESTVGGELALARSYLNLLRIRMGGRLSYSIDAAEAVGAHAFPPMMLMSLVENAIKHGLEPKAGPGSIAIVVTDTAGALRVEVRDDGVGFGEAAGSGIGLKNIRETLASMFGDRAHLVVEPNAGAGVTAIIEIPRLRDAGAIAVSQPAQSGPDHDAY